MGQAKRRGTFEERKAQAIARVQVQETMVTVRQASPASPRVLVVDDRKRHDLLISALMATGICGMLPPRR